MAEVHLVQNGQTTDARVTGVFAAVERNYGFVPNILRALANCPELLEVFVPFWARVYESPRIGPQLRAIAALGTAHARECNYCIGHMSESARRAGLQESQLHALSQGKPEAAFEPRERAVIQYASALTQHDGRSEDPVAPLRQYFDDGEIVNITLAVGLYNLTSLFLQSLRIDEDITLKHGSGQAAPEAVSGDRQGART